MAGIVLSEVAERIPEKLSYLIYASGYLLKGGETVVTASERAPHSLVTPNMALAADSRRERGTVVRTDRGTKAPQPHLSREMTIGMPAR